MPGKKRIEVGDELTIRVPVTATWDDGRLTFEIRANGQKVTIRVDNDDIVEVIKGAKPEVVRRKRGSLFDKPS